MSGWWASAPQCDYKTPSNEEGVSATDPCPPGDDGLMALVLAAGFIIFAIITTLVAAIELVRKISKLKEYLYFTGDHREFLSKYNRP